MNNTFKKLLEKLNGDEFEELAREMGKIARENARNRTDDRMLWATAGDHLGAAARILSDRTAR